MSELKRSSKEFYLKEYESLRREVEWLLKDYRDLERNVLIAIVASWVWLLEKGTALPPVVWFLPLLFALIGGMRATGIMQAFTNFHRYISEIELAFRSPGDPVGWEHFPKRGRFARSATSRFAGVFWGLVLLLTGIVAVYEYRLRTKIP
jgi:hypothetical protein